MRSKARHQWLMAVILATQETAIRRIKVQSLRPSLENTQRNIRLAEWLRR
jgi:hypothetical protein